MCVKGMLHLLENFRQLFADNANLTSYELSF